MNKLTNPIVCRGCSKELRPKAYTDNVIMHRLCPQCQTKITRSKDAYVILVGFEKYDGGHGEAEKYIFKAFGKDMKDIFGASTELYRAKRWLKGDKVEWSPWEINYGTSGAGEYEKKLPFVEAINKAMAKLKQLNK